MGSGRPTFVPTGRPRDGGKAPPSFEATAAIRDLEGCITLPHFAALAHYQRGPLPRVQNFAKVRR